MSFYTNNKPRLIEPHIAKKLLILHNPPKPKPKPIINYKKINNCVMAYFKRNWSFISIISILALLLIYRYRINQKENEMKKARQSYLDKLIMDNYMKEVEEESKFNYDNPEPIPLTPIPQNSNILLDQQKYLNFPTLNSQNTPELNQAVPNLNSNLLNQELEDNHSKNVQKQENDNIVSEALATEENIPNNTLSFDQIFQNNLDNTFSAFEGNSSYAPF